jgi:hypothetical protein
MHPSYGTNVSDPNHKAATASYNFKASLSAPSPTPTCWNHHHVPVNSYTSSPTIANRQPYFSLKLGFKKSYFHNLTLRRKSLEVEIQNRIRSFRSRLNHLSDSTRRDFFVETAGSIPYQI